MIKKKHGNVFGGMLLLAGSCIGAGMLGLPIMTGLSGFYPSLIAFFCIWAFMTLTGLLLVEVNGCYSKRVNFITMVGRTLGKKGKFFCWILYLFLFYSLLLAYIAGIGSLVAKISGEYFGLGIPEWGGSLFFVILFGWIIYFGTRPVDLWNRVLMAGKITVFLALVFFGVRHVQSNLLERSAPEYALYALPILVISFGFHNMIPSLTDYLQNDLKRVRRSIILGGVFALVIYLIWQIIVLGIVPMGGKSGIIASYKAGGEATQALVGFLGTSWISYFATFLAFFAILTSFLAQALSLSHFLADGLKVNWKRHEEAWLVVLTLLPPLFLAILYPNIFLHALNFAGGICAVVLFGIMPVLMVWKGRYKREMETSYRVFGGKALLVTLFLIALFVMFFQLSDMFNAPYIPKI
ncbi:MAG: Tyrosine-specific transport protein [Chlamydiae bacterium]|nr:Tyrosine-specific transport protein [Chlamydiota bacterium]